MSENLSVKTHHGTFNGFVDMQIIAFINERKRQPILS